MNHAIEHELTNFKKEIEEKFAKSKMNWEFYFPWKLIAPVYEDRSLLEQEDLVASDTLQLRKNPQAMRKDLNIYIEPSSEYEFQAHNTP